jgi:hypothetical protein
MNAEIRHFQPTHGFQVPDGTFVFPFLNSNDVNSGLPLGLLDAFSLAIGELEPVSESKIHVHPVVSQVTMVLDGRLEVRLREPSEKEQSTLQLARHEAVLVRPGTFLQLINRSVFPCRTLYIVGPAYVFEAREGGYDDAVTLDESWEELARSDWMPSKPIAGDRAQHERDAALQRLRSLTRSAG